MRLIWVGVFVVACTPTNAVDGQKVTLSSGDHLDVGNVRIQVSEDDKGTLVFLTEGTRSDTRRVSGKREVKFGMHRVMFEEKGSDVTVTVRPYKPSTPLSSDDALSFADEAWSPRASGAVDCKSATLTPDGKGFTVQCADEAKPGVYSPITIDAVTGAVLTWY